MTFKTWLSDLAKIQGVVNNIKDMVAQANGNTVALGNLTRASKAAELGLKALSVAGNMLVMWGISEAITDAKSSIKDYINSSEMAKGKKYIICHQNEMVILTEEYAKIYNEICQLK